MFRRIWIAGIALGLTLPTPLMGQEASTLESSQNDQVLEKRAVDSQNSSKILNVESDPASPGALYRQAVTSSDQPVFQDDEQDGAEYDFWRDTAAQWAMAIASALATLISGLAVWLVALTLRETKMMVGEAQNTTKAAQANVVAAQEAVEVTRKIGDAQLRAYLTIQSSAVFRGTEYHDDEVAVFVNLKNSGQTPAQNVRVTASFLAGSKEMRGNSKPPQISEAGSVQGAGETTSMSTRLSRRFTPAYLDQMKANDETFWFHGFVVYDDLFGKSWKYEFSYFLLDPRVLKTIKTSLTPTRTGNTITEIPKIDVQQQA